MKTNLIQSYLNNSTNLQQYNSDNAKKNFDVNKELLNRTFIKPLPSNGHLVRNTIFDYPAEFFKDIKYKANALKHSVQGKANDNELGSLNDAGMKLGGLAIATYLLTRRQTPLTKAMEFVGLCSFFGAMEIWPKLALQLPAYLIHGFNIRQQYRDNYDTKKPVFLDHQFIPWDLYTDEEINKIGDRMRVPRDIKNRRDFIQEKMRKIALQNNTLWMLTAGFATPIMSALICNALEHPISDYQDKKLAQKANDLLNKFNENAKKYDYSANVSELESILETNKGKNVSKEMIDLIASNLSQDFDKVTSQAIKKDIKRILGQNSGYDITTDVLERISKAIGDDYSKLKLDKSVLDKVVPTAKDLAQELQRNGLYDEASGVRNGINDFTQYLRVISNIGKAKLEQSDVSQEIKNRLKFKASNQNISHNADIVKALKSVSSSKLTEQTVKDIKGISSELIKLKSHLAVLDEYAYLKAAMAPETGLANGWNDLISKDLLKILGITNKEVKETRYDERIVGNLIREKIETIVSDKDGYEAVIKALRDKLSKIEERTRFANIDINTKNADTDNTYKKCVDSAFEMISEPLQKLKMNSTLQRLFGYETNDKSSLRNIQLSYVMDRVKGVKGAFYRMMNALDMFKRITELEKSEKTPLEGLPREVKEELVEMCKRLMLGGHSSDYAVKFYSRRNPDLNPSAGNIDKSELEIKDGKVVNKYVGHRDSKMLAENGHDRDFYERAMKLMYNEKLHPDTSRNLEGSLFYENFDAWRKNVLRIFGGDKYFVRQNHLVDGKEVGSTSNEKFLQLGNALDDMFTKLFRSHYNSNRWLKFFSAFGAGLLGITLLAQFFFGHMHTDRYEAKQQ